MAEDQIHILHIQALQGRLQGHFHFPSECVQLKMQYPGVSLAPNADSRPAGIGARAKACTKPEQIQVVSHKSETDCNCRLQDRTADLHALNDVLPGETLVVDALATPEDLGRENIV